MFLIHSSWLVLILDNEYRAVQIHMLHMELPLRYQVILESYEEYLIRISQMFQHIWQ